MKLISNFFVVVAGILIILTGYVWEKAEMLLEGSVFGQVVDGILIATLFFGIMQLLKWAVWVMG